MPKLKSLLLASVAMFAMLAFSHAVAGESKEPSLEGLGDQLLDDDLLKELMQQPPVTPNPAPQQPAIPDGEDIGPQESPLERIEQRMAAAGDLIESQNTTGETKVVQQQIINELDQLIDKLNKQCKNCKNGQCNNPGQQQTQKQTPKPGQGSKPQQSSSSQAAAADSSATQGGQAVEGELNQAANTPIVKQLWGQLPERLRQQLLQSSADEFLPKYREQLEQYFRRLAEEQSDATPTP